MIFEKQHFDKYCNGRPYEDTLDIHLITYYRLCRIYSDIMDLSVPQIVHWLKDKTVLDVGCAMGHVVSDLWNNDIQAWGYDASEYAINNKVSHRVWLGNHDEQLLKIPHNTFDIIFANSFQYTFDKDQLMSWLKNTYKVCRHSVLFCCTVQDDMQCNITENIKEIQIVRPRFWWNKIFMDAGFLTSKWVAPSLGVYLKNELHNSR